MKPAEVLVIVFLFAVFLLIAANTVYSETIRCGKDYAWELPPLTALSKMESECCSALQAESSATCPPSTHTKETITKTEYVDVIPETCDQAILDLEDARVKIVNLRKRIRSGK